MNKKLLHIITVFVITLFVSACGNEPCRRDCDENGRHCKTDCGSGSHECVEADDWGDPKIWVPAGLGENPYDTNLEIKGGYDGQVAKAIDTNQVLLDSNTFPLVISIGKRDQWTSWFGGKDINPKGSNGKPDPNGWDGGRMVRNVECEYFVTHGNSPGDIKDDLSPATVWQALYSPQDLFYMGADNKYYKIPSKDPYVILDRDGKPDVDRAGKPVLHSNSKTRMCNSLWESPELCPPKNQYSNLCCQN